MFVIISHKILAWLMRSVSNPTALHDLLWWYASSLEFKEEEENSSGKVSDLMYLNYQGLFEDHVETLTCFSETLGELR